MADSSGANIETAHHFNESDAQKGLESILEVLEGVVLVLVAVVTP